MLINIVIWIAILICTVKTLGYGVYTLKKNNKTGGIALLILAVFTAASALVFM